MADGIGKFEKKTLSSELQRIKKICDGSICGIVSNQLTKEDIKSLETDAKNLRSSAPSSLKEYTSAIYANSGWLQGPWATKARKYVRMQGLQGRCSSIFTRWVLAANFKDK